MRAIKAYVRRIKVDEVVHALKAIGVPDITIIDIMDVGAETDSGERRVSVELGEEYRRMTKLEIVCEKEKAGEIIRTLRESARTGEPGDGIIYVMKVDRAIKIRTGDACC
jgi:nitrogen regulatory protein P-II 1